MSRRGRKRKMESEDKAVFEWEKEKIFKENLRDEMETSWELPQIYHFLQLTKEAFNITHLSMYEVERMLLMPKASRQLAHIMTCLLSNPHTIKSKLHKVPLMPYAFWTNLLMFKLKNWFKIYQSKRLDPIKTFDTLGIEPEFWKIFPANEIEGKEFQELSFKQRIWLLKTVCDTAMHTRKVIQDEISRQPWENQFETVLGTDRYGARYVYFPQFLHNDLRVYRHCLDNKVLSTVRPRPSTERKQREPEETKQEEEEQEEEEAEAEQKESPKPTAVPSRGKRKKRRSRWSKGALPHKIQKRPVKTKIDCSQSFIEHNISVDSNSNSTDTGRESRCSSKASEFSASSCAKSSGYETNASTDVPDNNKVEKEDKGEAKDTSEVVENEAKVEEDASLNTTEESMSEDKKADESLDKTSNEDSLVKDSNGNPFTTMDDLSKSSKTDDEKLEEMNASKSLEKPESEAASLTPNATKDLNTSKSDDEKLSESKKCDTPTDPGSESASDELSLDKWIKKKLEEKEVKDEYGTADSDNEADYSTLQGGCSRRSARIKYITEIKTEVEEAENMMDVCETEELSSIDLRDSLCRVSSPEEDFFNEDFNENEWKVADFNELTTDLSVSSFQLVADSVDSLKDLAEYISSDKTVPEYESKESVYETPVCEVKLLKRIRKLVSSLENVESLLKESTKKARNKLQRELNNFENGTTEEDQEQQDGEEVGAANRWLVGPQGYNLERLLNSGADQCAEVLPITALSRDSGEYAETKDPSSDINSASTSSRSDGQTGQIKEETASALSSSSSERRGDGEEAAGEEEIVKEGKECKKEGDRRSSKDYDDGGEAEREEAEDEPRQTRRVLRANRSMPSYTEQLFFDDESDEEQLDGWADIEAVYAPAGTSTRLSTSDPLSTTPAASSSATAATDATNDSYDDEDEEDSDQDWILPGSRKRKSKRPSASRRLKTFQHKIQNIQDHKAADESNTNHHYYHQQQQPRSSQSPMGKISRQATTRKYNQQITKIQRIRSIASNIINQAPVPTTDATHPVPSEPGTEVAVKTEPQDPNLHSVLDIKDEGPIYDSALSNQPNNNNPTASLQQNYVVVTTGQAPVANYYVMQQNPTATVVQQSQYIQPTAYVPQMAPSIFAPMQQVQNVPAQGYYVQSANPNYIVQSSAGIIASTPVVYQQQQQPIVHATPNYVQYVAAPMQQQQQQQQQPTQLQQSPNQPRIINTTTLSPPRQIMYRPRFPGQVSRMPGPLTVGQRPNFPHPPNGAVIRSAPIVSNVLRPGQRTGQPRNPGPAAFVNRRQVPRAQAPVGVKKPVVPGKLQSRAQQNSTSLIVLSDSDDDEIEMIIPAGSPSKPMPKQIPIAPAPAAKSNVIPPELLERMNEGNISLSPIKPAAAPVPTLPASGSGSNTQLVVVVNETGSHYALALPNGSKLILTPEQVAQIRASNGGKLLL